LDNTRKISFYTEKLLWKLARSRLPGAETLTFEVCDEPVRNSLMKYTVLPPVIVFWDNEKLWTFVNGQQLMSLHDGNIYHIDLDSINKKIKTSFSAKSKDGAKFHFNHLFLGKDEVMIWAPEGNVIFALMNILQMFPLNVKNDCSRLETEH